MIEAEGGAASALRADITVEDDCRAIAETVVERYGRVDILVNNVGIGTGDTGATKLTEETWDLHPRRQPQGHVADLQARPAAPARAGLGRRWSTSRRWRRCARSGFLAYKTSKAGVNALTHQLAMTSAKRGVRVNAIMPGLMDTPMAIEGIAAAAGIDPDELRAHARRPWCRSARKHGHGLGRRRRRAVPGVGRGRVHHRRRACPSTAASTARIG